jgi:BolA family transcriptional regulator, general stress-responsive regulator
MSCGRAAGFSSMSSIHALIETALRQAFAPERLAVLDESAAHAGHAGHSGHGESHFRVRIVSPHFAGRSRIDRHRLVNEALKPAFERGVHALAIEASAPGEAVRW